MTNAYLVNGTLVSSLKAEAKAAKKASGGKLTDAQDQVAQARGYNSWQQMVERTITLDEEFADNFTMEMRAGQDRYVLHLDFLEDGDYLDRSGAAFRKIFAKRDLLLGADPGAVEHHIDFVFGEEAERFHSLHVLKNATSARKINQAVNEIFGSGDASAFVAILNDSGFFDRLDDIPLFDIEFEAELMLILRKVGRTVGDRVLLNTDSSPDTLREIEVDWDRRCFANLLDNGDIVVSNGASGKDLLHKVMTAAEFKVLEREMLQACGPTAASSGRGEIWMFDRVLAEAPATDIQPEM